MVCGNECTPKKNQGGMGHLAVCYTGPQSFNIRFSLIVGFTTFVTWLNFDWLIPQVACLSVSTTNFNLQKG